MTGTRAAPRAAAFLVYGAGLAQGLALVSFPAASSVLISPTGYDLSTTAYGLMFVPQVVLAITAAALSPVWARRWSLQRVLQAGLVANCVAMLLLVSARSCPPPLPRTRSCCARPGRWGSGSGARSRR